MFLSGAWGKVIHEKNLKQKISWHCPFKLWKYAKTPRGEDTSRSKILNLAMGCRTFHGFNNRLKLCTQKFRTGNYRKQRCTILHMYFHVNLPVGFNFSAYLTECRVTSTYTHIQAILDIIWHYVKCPRAPVKFKNNKKNHLLIMYNLQRQICALIKGLVAEINKAWTWDNIGCNPYILIVKLQQHRLYKWVVSKTAFIYHHEW
jgi:hypothetical protein